MFQNHSFQHRLIKCNRKYALLKLHILAEVSSKFPMTNVFFQITGNLKQIALNVPESFLSSTDWLDISKFHLNFLWHKCLFILQKISLCTHGLKCFRIFPFTYWLIKHNDKCFKSCSYEIDYAFRSLI